jgi:ABC-type branched-subunit amino acid transport system substrate-binding protein
MDQLLQLYRQDTHLYGILGLPFSASDDQATARQQTNDWYKYGSPLPIISPSATSEKLTGRTNFYRISSPDHVQVCDMLQEIATSLGPAYDPGYEHDRTHQQLNLAVFYDPKDAYSTSLYTDLTDMVDGSPNLTKTCLAFSNFRYRINLIHETMTISSSGNYLPAIKSALRFTPDMIYFAGYSFGLDAFETQLQQAQGTRYSAYPVPIVGGDGLYSVDRLVTNTAYRVYATTYASPVPPSNSSNSQSYEALQALLHSYNSQFRNIQGGQGADTIPLLPAHAILSYDAADAFICALGTTLGTNTLPDQQFIQPCRSTA